MVLARESSGAVMIFDNGTDDETVRMINGTLLRRGTVWTWGAYWFVDQGFQWSAWRLETSGYSGHVTVLVGTWYELADAVQGVHADEQRRREEGADR